MLIALSIKALSRRKAFTSCRAISTQTNIPAAGQTMPPGFAASVEQLKTFVLPDAVHGSPSDLAMGRAMLETWKRDGILQIVMTQQQQRMYAEADKISKGFFAMSHAEKAACVDAQSYAGYIASGEEITDGIADYSEIFTVTKDLSPDDPRVAAGWPCHGPCPWPNASMKNIIGRYMDDLAESGEKLLQLIELGLEVPRGSMTKLTEDGWHHLRVLR